MKALVLLSGGLDSAVLLADVVTCGVDCVAVTFNYGQVHAQQEIAAAMRLAGHYSAEHLVIGMPRGIFGPSALTGNGDIPFGHAEKPDSTLVPGRNAVLIAGAAAIAEGRGARTVLIGATAEDSAGYPDCRPRFISAMSDAVWISSDGRVQVAAPYSGMTKQAVTFRGRSLGVPLDWTWSCYVGGEQPCGRCGACESRNEAMA